MQSILGLDPISFILKQEKAANKLSTADPQNEAIQNLYNCSSAWDQFRASPNIKKSPKYDSFSIPHISNLVIPFYIARWHFLVRDETRVFHLKPALVYITAFVDQMRYIKLYSNDSPKIKESREQIVKQLNPSNKTNAKEILTLLLRKSVEEAISMKANVMKEIDECLRDEIRASKLQNINIAIDSQLVFSPITQETTDDLLGDLEDIVPRSSSDNEEYDSETQRMRSEQSDYKAACDLMGDLMDFDDSTAVDDPLEFIPSTKPDFKALQEAIKPKYEKLNSQERMSFAFAFLEKALPNCPAFVIKDIAKEIKIKKNKN